MAIYLTTEQIMKKDSVKYADPKDMTKDDLKEAILWHKNKIRLIKEGYFDKEKFKNLKTGDIENSLYFIDIYQKELIKDLIKKIEDF